MAAPDPGHPDYPSRVRMTPTSLAGAGTTASDDPLTTGRASRAKAVLGASASPPGSSLLDAYAKWKASSQDAAQALGKKADMAADTESVALRKSAKRLAKHLREGVSPARAAVLAHAHYRKHGGRSGVDVWSRRVAEGG